MSWWKSHDRSEIQHFINFIKISHNQSTTNCIRLRQTPQWKIPVPLETQPLASCTASCYKSTTMSKPDTHHHESRTAALKIKFSSLPVSQLAVLSSQPSYRCRCQFKPYSDAHPSPVFPLPASYIQYFTLFFRQQLCDLCTGRQHLLSLWISIPWQFDNCNNNEAVYNPTI